MGVSENDKIPSHMKCLIGKTGKYDDASKFGGTKCSDKPLYHQSLELQPAIVHPYYFTLLRKWATAKPATINGKSVIDNAEDNNMAWAIEQNLKVPPSHFLVDVVPFLGLLGQHQQPTMLDTTNALTTSSFRSNNHLDIFHLGYL